MSKESSIELAKKRLADLNPKSVRPEEIAEVLYIAAGANKLLQEFGNKHWSCDIHQFLLPFFRPLFQKEPEIRERVIRELLSLGLSVDLVSDYFLNMGNQPYLIFALKHGERIKNPCDKAEEIMLRELREYLFS